MAGKNACPTLEDPRMQHPTRREFLGRSATAAAIAALPAHLLAQQTAADPERTAALLIKPQTQAAIDRGLAWLAGRQKDDGRRYQPKVSEADISVTICQVMALRAARNAGLYVPNETIDRCIDYVKRSQNADGGFMYMLTGGPSRFPRSAAGVVALYSSGI